MRNARSAWTASGSCRTGEGIAAVAKAPLRETLAAGLLMASEWDGAAPLLVRFAAQALLQLQRF